MEALTTLIPTMIVMEAAVATGDTQLDTILATLPQVIAIVVAILGVGYGWREKKLAAKQGSQTIEKNTFDQLVSENQLLISKLKLLRKDQDKWFLLRVVVLEQHNGPEIVQAVEKKAEEISSDE